MSSSSCWSVYSLLTGMTSGCWGVFCPQANKVEAIMAMKKDVCLMVCLFFCFEKRILVFLDALGKGNAVENAAAESDFVGVFEVVADSDATGDGGDFYTEGCQLFIEIECGGIAFHGGGEGKDDLFDGSGESLLDAREESVDVEVADADAVDRGDDPAKNVVEPAVLLGVFDGHDVLDILYNADDALGAFGTCADGAGVGVAEAVAEVAVMDVGGEAVDSGGQLLDLFRGLFEEVKSETQCRPFAYAGKVGEVLDGVGEGV